MTRPTYIRYVILTLTVAVAVLLYLDRFCLSFVINYIKEDLRLTSGETGFLLGAFFLTYAFGQLPGGYLSDRYGTRVMLAFYLAVWSILTALMGLATGLVTLLLFRFGCGLFEAGAYPACAGLIRRWVPYEKRGLASGIVSIGGRIGGAVAPAMTAYLMVVFMPISTPSIVEPADILMPRTLARSVLLIADDGKEAPEHIQLAARRLQASMPVPSAQLRAVADLPASADVTLPPGEGDPTAPQVLLAKVVNHWLEQPDLLEGMDLKPIMRKLNKQATELLNKKQSERTAAETARLNRMVLEVYFPEGIRKLYGDSWPPVLVIYGSIGVLIAIVFYSFYRNTPRDHFLANDAEADLIEAHEKTHAGSEPTISTGALWKGLLTDVGLWASSIVQFGTNFGWIFPASLLPLYLTEVHQVPEETRGFMSSLPFLISLPMMIFGGFWTDWMTTRWGKRLGRCFPIASTRFLTGAAFIVCWYLNAPWPIVIVLCILSVVNDMGIPAIWAYNLDVGKANVGLVLGWGNMWGNLGAFVSPIVLLWLREQFTDKKAGYDAIFLTCAGVFIFIGFVSLLIDATKPIGGVPDGAQPTPLPSDAVAPGEPPYRA